ncbi:unnamed protein product [Phytophthora fragariaefolia]|uniref:Unnamed protein product n=1 Tax=Phytophthora fragariaefolia TaxID=1490495 RepID=A0A9W7D7U4_9STRA|nr:unnamed protein product [Phytophthora fragariaefolia]
MAVVKNDPEAGNSRKCCSSQWIARNGPTLHSMMPPRITLISPGALVKWNRERREYEEKLKAPCRISGEDYDTVVESVSSAFEADSHYTDLLDAFCDFKLHKESSDVTDGMLLAEIAHIVDIVKNNTLPDIKELFKRGLKLIMGESDVEAGVLDYFKMFNRIMTDNCLKEFFKDADGRRENA